MAEEKGIGVSRKSFIASSAAGAAAILAASALSLPAEADGNDHNSGLYGNGMVWNSALPGVAGEVKLKFDIWIDLKGGNGLGIVSDPLHPDWECYFAISSVVQDKAQNDTIVYKMYGIVTMANAPSNVGLPVKIYAEARAESTGIGIALGDLGFGGAGIITTTSFRSPSRFTSVSII